MWGMIKSFFKYINGNRQCKNIISPFQDEDGYLTNWGRGKAEVFNTFFMSVFSISDGLRGSQCSELEDSDL